MYIKCRMKTNVEQVLKKMLIKYFKNVNVCRKNIDHVFQTYDFFYHAYKNVNQAFEKQLKPYLKNVDQAFEKC